MRRLDPKECAVLIIDVQEKLTAAMPAAQMADVCRAGTVLIEAARMLGAGILATEQYPTGLGPTVAALAGPLDRASVRPIPKLEFSACDNLEFDRQLSKSRAKTIVVVGLETHVCVFQTVRELCARGVNVVVPIDGVVSRRDDHRVAGLDLCRTAGAMLTTMESIVFDWLRRSGTDDFKKLSKLIR